MLEIEIPLDIRQSMSIHVQPAYQIDDAGEIRVVVSRHDRLRRDEQIRTGRISQLPEHLDCSDDLIEIARSLSDRIVFLRRIAVNRDDDRAQPAADEIPRQVRGEEAPVRIEDCVQVEAITFAYQIGEVRIERRLAPAQMKRIRSEIRGLPDNGPEVVEGQCVLVPAAVKGPPRFAVFAPGRAAQ